MARWRTKHGFCIQNSFRGLFIAPPHNLRHWVNVGELFVEVITSNTMFWVAEIRWSCCRFSFQRGKESCLLLDYIFRGIFVRFRPNAERVVDLGRPCPSEICSVKIYRQCWEQCPCPSSTRQKCYVPLLSIIAWLKNLLFYTSLKL